MDTQSPGGPQVHHISILPCLILGLIAGIRIIKMDDIREITRVNLTHVEEVRANIERYGCCWNDSPAFGAFMREYEPDRQTGLMKFLECLQHYVLRERVRQA